MAIIDTLDYLGTSYDIADTTARASLSTKATVPSGGVDGQVMLKKGDAFEWGTPQDDSSIVGYGNYNANDKSCAVAMTIPSDENYTIKVYGTSSLTVTSFSKTATQITVNFNKQSVAGEICVVARKVG